jgi:DNA-binding NarL/FixJ family response regulator
VSRLSERDASALLAFVGELKDLDDPLPFPPRLLARMGDLIAADQVAYSELDPLKRELVLGAFSKADGEDEVLQGPVADASSDGGELWWQLRGTHPLCSRRTRTGDWTSARKVSDFVTLCEFRRTPIYDAFYRGVLDHWLDVGLAPKSVNTRVFVFTRYGRPDFDERDRLVAALLQPQLAERAESAEVALRGAEALAAVEDGTSDARGRIVLCSRNGVIEFASAASRAMLERYLGLDNGRVPATVLDRPEWQLVRDDRRLQIRIAKTDSLHVLILDERDLRVEKLTARERQILELVALGNENEAISFELGIAPATVAKHLEHAYRKLGVQNRTAAAALLDQH